MTDLETLNKLYLELSHVVTASSEREIKMMKAVSLLNSMVLSGEQHTPESIKIVNDAFGEKVYSSEDDPKTVSIARNIADGIIEAEGDSAFSNNRDRPYNGQRHTFEGVRGSSVIAGLTIRDICDCYTKGMLLASSYPNLQKRAIAETWVRGDLYNINLDDLDPVAVMQNMCVEIEKMAGIDFTSTQRGS